MNYFKLVAVFFVLLLTCCDDGNAPGVKRLKVYADAEVIQGAPFVRSGEHLVFHLYRESEDREDIADDEFSEELYLEIIPENGEFLFNSDAFALYDLPFVYRQYCFCAPANRYSLSDLNFSGVELSDGNWRLTGSLTVLLEFVDQQTEMVLESFQHEIILSGTYRLSDF